jgi:hypothetical protein
MTSGFAPIPSWSKKTVPSRATPKAPPSCWTAVRVPEAEPLSCCSTPASTMLKNGAISRPIPMPVTVSAGTNCQGVTSIPARVTVSRTPSVPSAMTRTPPCRTLRPNRCTAWARPKPTTIPSDQGIITRPAFSVE